MRSSTIITSLAVAALLGCSSPPSSKRAPEPSPAADGEKAAGTALADDDPAAEPGNAAADTAPVADAIGETEARTILADAFRRAGFRILYDVPIASQPTVALDGYDPVKKVGYEYIAAEELASAASVEPLASSSILVLGPSSRVDVIDKATRFVAALLEAQDE